MALDNETVGRRIAEARDAHGWSAGELAKLVGSSHRSVQRWEAGKLPRTKTLLRLADVLDVPSYFFVQFPEFDELRSRMERIEEKLDAALNGGRKARPRARRPPRRSQQEARKGSRS